MQFDVVALSVFSIVLLAVPAILLVKAKIVDPKKALPTLSAILLYVNSPALVFANFQESDYSKELLTDLLHSAIIAMIVFLIFGILAVLIVNPQKSSIEKRIYAYASVFPNCAYIGIPIIMSIFPGQPEPIIYCAVMASMFNMVTWTLGIYLLTGDKKYISIKKAFLNPSTLGLIVAFPLFLIDFKLANYLPQLSSLIMDLANSTAPISMFVLGTRLASMPIKRIFFDKKCYIVVLLKLIAMPCLAFFMLKAFPFANELVLTVAFIIATMPTATATITFAEQYADNPEPASSSFILTTILSIITIPIALLFV